MVHLLILLIYKFENRCDRTPKGTEFKNIQNTTLKEIQNKLNNRPRKILGVLTPIEYTKKYCNEIKN
jgi:IS30 family transposase